MELEMENPLWRPLMGKAERRRRDELNRHDCYNLFLAVANVTGANQDNGVECPWDNV